MGGGARYMITVCMISDLMLEALRGGSLNI